jgi:hypothetical protein
MMESSGEIALVFLSRQTTQDRSGPLKSHPAELVAQIWKQMVIHRILDAVFDTHFLAIQNPVLIVKVSCCL